jgi:hypothetical protein
MLHGKERVAGVGAVMSFMAAGAGESAAGIITYDFEATVTSGDLVGNTYSGSFAYDDETPPHATDPPFEFVAVEDFQFTFEGKDFGLTDINDFNDPGVRFQDSAFAGLGGVDTGEGGAFHLRPNGHAGYQSLGIEGDTIFGGGSGIFSQGAVTYQQVPEPSQGLLLPVALFALACQKLAANLWARLRPRPTSG